MKRLCPRRPAKTNFYKNKLGNFVERPFFMIMPFFPDRKQFNAKQKGFYQNVVIDPNTCALLGQPLLRSYAGDLVFILQNFIAKKFECRGKFFYSYKRSWWFSCASICTSTVECNYALFDKDSKKCSLVKSTEKLNWQDIEKPNSGKILLEKVSNDKWNQSKWNISLRFQKLNYWLFII